MKIHAKETHVLVRLPAVLKRAVEKRAKKENRTVSSVVREMMMEYAGKEVATRPYVPKAKANRSSVAR